MHRNSTGEMFVTGQQFSLADGRLNIDLSVDFEGLRMPSDRSLTLTPVLISGENEQSPAGGTHQRQGKAESVPAAKGICRKRASAPIPAVVIRNDARIARSFRYQVAVPYKEWMKDARLLMRTKECACHGKQGKA